MPSNRPGYPSRRIAQVLLVALMLGVVVMTSACGGNAQLQQQASLSKAQLDPRLHTLRALECRYQYCNPF